MTEDDIDRLSERRARACAEQMRNTLEGAHDLCVLCGNGVCLLLRGTSSCDVNVFACALNVKQ